MRCSDGMYKIKPRDIEAQHWEQFDLSAQGRLFDALQKVDERELPRTEPHICAQLDINAR